MGILATEAGLPRDVFNIITGDEKEIGKILCDDFRIRKLSFTGSTKVGQTLYSQCAKTLKRTSFELGGNAPFIVFNDCDIDKVSDDLLEAKRKSSGQSCTAPNRVFIKQEIYKKFIDVF